MSKLDVLAVPPPGPALEVRRPPRPDLHGALAGYRTAQTPEAADRLLAAAGPVIGKAVKAYAGADTPTTRAKAKQIVLGVGPRYDPRAARPETYLLAHLQSLRRYGANLAAPARLPDRVRLDAPRVDRHAEELRQGLGREPTDAEIADASGLPVERVARSRGVPAAFVASAMPEGLETVAPARADASRRAWARYVYHDLEGPVARLVFEHGWGLNGKPVLPTSEIARLAGVTAGAVSQHKARIEGMLNEYADFVGGR